MTRLFLAAILAASIATSARADSFPIGWLGPMGEMKIICQHTQPIRSLVSANNERPVDGMKERLEALLKLPGVQNRPVCERVYVTQVILMDKWRVGEFSRRAGEPCDAWAYDASALILREGETEPTILNGWMLQLHSKPREVEV